jgi:hypothetical protein
MLLEWAECVDARAFLPVLSDVFDRLIETLKGVEKPPEEAWRLEQLTVELEALRQEHEEDPCVRYKWLAKRTYRYMDTPALTLRQYQRLTGHRHPGMVNIIPGNLVPWEYAVDEVADRLGMGTSAFADCVVRAYEREGRILSILEELKEALE